MLHRRVFNFNKWESVSLLIAGLDRLNFTHMFQCLQDTVKHLMNSYVMDSDLLERCRQYNVNLDMSFHYVKMVITESFWSAVDYICLLKCVHIYGAISLAVLAYDICFAYDMLEDN
jgi:hypothetical protein